MGRFLKIFGAICAFIVVAIVLIVVVMIVKGSALDKESKAYATAVISAVASNWDEQALTSRASTEFMAVTSRTQLDQFFERVRELGRMNGCKDLQGQASFSLTTWSGERVTAAYAGDCNFQEGAARVSVNLVKHGSNWQVAGFNVTPVNPHPVMPAMLEPGDFVLKAEG
jgi:hypothetical protein